MARDEAIGIVELRGLVVSGYCGVLPEEKERPQPLEIDFDLEVEMTHALETDSLDEAVDYGVLCAAVEHLLETDRFALLESLAVRLAEIALADGRVRVVDVSVRKLRPPVPQHLSTAGVRVRRRQTD